MTSQVFDSFRFGVSQGGLQATLGHRLRVACTCAPLWLAIVITILTVCITILAVCISTSITILTVCISISISIASMLPQKRESCT